MIRIILRIFEGLALFLLHNFTLDSTITIEYFFAAAVLVVVVCEAIVVEIKEMLAR